MSISEHEWKVEEKWLQKTLKEINEQIDEKSKAQDKLKKESVETNKELWDDVGSISNANDLESLVEFMSYVDTMKSQKRSYEFTTKMKEKYKVMLKSPYFGRIDFTEDGESINEKCYIGISNLIDKDYDFLIYDWRAPISSMFYDYEVGKASYECPQGIISGEVTTKRQYKVSDGKIEYMFDSNLNIDDEALQELLSNNSSDKMKAIVTSIQREQNMAIRNEEYKNLIVQGAAGSGKTSVALHRIAYLLYKHKDKINSKNIMIFSPNNVFNDYISNVLPQLGEDNMIQTTFKDYSHNVLGRGFYKETPSKMMEYILDGKNRTSYKYRIKNIKFKTSVEFIDVLKEYISYLEDKERGFVDIILRDEMIISAKEIQDLFAKDYSNLPIKRRLEKIKSRILFLLDSHKEAWVKEIYEELFESDEYFDKLELIEKSNQVVDSKLKGIYDDIDKMTTFNLMDIYKDLFENLDTILNRVNISKDNEFIDLVKNYTLDNINRKVLNYEDQVALIYLKVSLGDIREISKVKYVIIDEAQDYTPLQYEIFYKLFNNASMTILGDINQSINPFMNVGNYDNVHKISSNDTCIINLTKSYRSTVEITKFARNILSEHISDEYVERHGDEPKVMQFEGEYDIKQKIIEDISCYKDDKYESIAVITRTAREAKEVYEFVKDRDIDVNIITGDDDKYVTGVVVIPSYLAKGLEFDVVLIYNASDYDGEDERLLFYTACTRALHVLNLYCIEECELLKNK